MLLGIKTDGPTVTFVLYDASGTLLDRHDWLAERALAKGCKVAPVENYYLQATGQEDRQLPQIILYFSQIPAADLEEAVQLLAEAWCE